MPRIFVALPIPLEAATAVAAALPDLPGLKRVSPELLHLTLAFVGGIDEQRVGEVEAAARSAGGSARPFRVPLGPLGRFPPNGPPTVVWAGTGAAAAGIERLGGAVRRELESAGVPFDPKPLRPHVTLARVRERATPEEARAIAAAVAAATVPAGLGFAADAIEVVESVLGREGPRYRLRGRYRLTGEGQRPGPGL